MDLNDIAHQKEYHEFRKIGASQPGSYDKKYNPLHHLLAIFKKQNQELNMIILSFFHSVREYGNLFSVSISFVIKPISIWIL